MILDWARKLNEFNATEDTIPLDDYEDRLEEETAKLLDSPPPAKSSQNADLSYRLIPTFFNKDTATNPLGDDDPDKPEVEESEMHLNVAEIAREVFLDTHEERLLSEHDLDCLFNNMVTLLKQYCPSKNIPNNNCFLSYDIFRELRRSLPPRAHKFFTASVFRKFPMNRHGQIRGLSFHQFVSISVNLLHQFITLCRYDISSNIVTGTQSLKSHLTESDLELFIGDQIEMVPELNNIDEAFHPYYIYHAVRQFVFCLNPESTKKYIPITKILCSESFREFNEFRFSSQQSAVNRYFLL